MRYSSGARIGENPSEFIEVVAARQNNLKDINLKLPLGQLIVVTSVSGSGKTIRSTGGRASVHGRV